MNTSTSQLLPIPQGLNMAGLTDAINDRLRRIRGQGSDSSAGTAGTTKGRATSNGTYVLLLPGGSTVTIDLSLGSYFDLALTSSAFTISAPTNSARAIAAGDRFTLYLDQPSGGGAPLPSFTGGSGGFASDTATRAAAAYLGTASTKTGLAFLYHGSVWILDSIPFTGAAIS